MQSQACYATFAITWCAQHNWRTTTMSEQQCSASDKISQQFHAQSWPGKGDTPSYESWKRALVLPRLSELWMVYHHKWTRKCLKVVDQPLGSPEHHRKQKVLSITRNTYTCQQIIANMTCAQHHTPNMRMFKDWNALHVYASIHDSEHAPRFKGTYGACHS